MLCNCLSANCYVFLISLSSLWVCVCVFFLSCSCSLFFPWPLFRDLLIAWSLTFIFFNTVLYLSASASQNECIQPAHAPFFTLKYCTWWLFIMCVCSLFSWLKMKVWNIKDLNVPFIVSGGICEILYILSTPKKEHSAYFLLQCFWWNWYGHLHWIKPGKCFSPKENLVDRTEITLSINFNISWQRIWCNVVWQSCVL